MLARVVCFSLLISSAFAAPLSAEFLFDPPLTRTSIDLSYVTDVPFIARTTSGFVVVWADNRSGLLSKSIVALRLSPDGAPVDTQASVGISAGDVRQPTAACNGDQCVVVFLRSSSLWSVTYDASLGLWGTVQPVLAVLDRPNSAALVFDGTHYVLAYQLQLANQVSVCLLNGAGQLVGMPVPVSAGAAEGSVSGARVSGGTLLGWHANGRIITRVWTVDGGLTAPLDLGPGNYLSAVAVGAEGDEALASWVVGNNLVMARFNATTSLVRDVPHRTVDFVGVYFGQSSIAVRNGLNFVVYTNGAGELRSATVDSAGMLSPGAVIRPPRWFWNGGPDGTVAAGVSAPVVAWREFEPNAVGVGVSALATSPLRLADATLVDQVASPQRSPSWIWQRDHALVAWTEGNRNSSMLKLGRVELSGTVQAVRTVVDAGLSEDPTLIWHESLNRVGVAWSLRNINNRELVFAPLDRPLTSPFVLEATNGTNLTSVSTPVGPVMVWLAFISSRYQVHARRWDPDGGLSAMQVLASDVASGVLALSAGRDAGLIVWGASSVLAAPIDFTRLGRLDGGTSLAVHSGHGPIDVASDGTDHLVVWSVLRGGFQEVFGQRVSAAGLLLDAMPFEIVSSSLGPATEVNSASPQVTFDGRDYQVSWLGGQADGGALLRWRSVSSSGVVGAVQEWRRTAHPISTFSALRLGERIGTAWAEYQPSTGATQLRARWFAFLNDGQTCFDATECRSGNCVANVCCLGCSSDAGTTDGGATDGGTPDGGATDSGTTDGGGTDGGTPDGGATDSGTTDGGTTDGGTADGGTNDSGTNDSGTNDSGTNDSGTNDSGTADGGATDGGTTDGGTTDGGATDAEPKPSAKNYRVGCESSSGTVPFVVLMLFLRWRR